MITQRHTLSKQAYAHQHILSLIGKYTISPNIRPTDHYCVGPLHTTALVADLLSPKGCEIRASMGQVVQVRPMDDCSDWDLGS